DGRGGYRGQSPAQREQDDCGPDHGEQAVGDADVDLGPLGHRQDAHLDAQPYAALGDGGRDDVAGGEDGQRAQRPDSAFEQPQGHGQDDGVEDPRAPVENQGAADDHPNRIVAEVGDVRADVAQ